MKKEIGVFNIQVHPFSRKEFLDIIELNLKQGNQIIQNGVNAASINQLVKNKKLVNTYNNSDLVNIDGMSMVWALRFLGYSVPERVACPDLAEDILVLAEKKNYSIFLFGAEEKSLLLSIRNLGINFPKLLISGYRNGYYHIEDEGSIVEMINNAMPDILFLGMPSPRKELFVEKYKDQLKVKYFFGVGGFFDILAGKTKRAPLWMQNAGLEWLYRFAQEPKRMWHRYLIGNMKFLLLVIKEKYKIIRKKKN
ncbi:MAG: WecB/TagA/CpsF family glycosyltransferase [Ginsengibacter sp.]